MKKTNFHTHVYRCGHATGNVKDYVREAVENGYEAIGVSDHGPLPDYLFDRMGHSEVEEYLNDINEAISEFGDKIKIYKALELEYFPEFDEYYKDLEEKFDYLVLGHHYYDGRKSSWHVETVDNLETYANELIRAMESGHFAFAAHPDLFASAYPIWDENCIAASYKICKKALELELKTGDLYIDWIIKAFLIVNVLKNGKFAFIIKDSFHTLEEVTKLTLEYVLNTRDIIKNY